MLDTRPAAPATGVSLLDLVAVLILAGLLWWGAHAVAAVTHDATPAAPHAAPARH